MGKKVHPEKDVLWIIEGKWRHSSERHVRAYGSLPAPTVTADTITNDSATAQLCVCGGGGGDMAIYNLANLTAWLKGDSKVMKEIQLQQTNWVWAKFGKSTPSYTVISVSSPTHLQLGSFTRPEVLSVIYQYSLLDSFQCLTTVEAWHPITEAFTSNLTIRLLLTAFKFYVTHLEVV